MELKLNIYNKKEIIKTYTAETYDILFGTVEDLINVLDLDNLNSQDNLEVVKVAMNVVMSGMDIVKPLLKDIFDGLTDNELRNTSVREVANVLVEVVKFTLHQISMGSKGKN